MKCEWCWARGVELNVTVQGDDQSPELCHGCTDSWDSGARKYVHKLRALRERVS